MSWIIENWAVVGTVLLAVIRLLESIMELTPTDVDNKIVAVLKNFFTLGWKKKED